MRKRLFISLVLVCAVLFASCEAEKSKKAPGWTHTGESGEYPSSLYLVGIGSARDTGMPDEDRTAADESARVNLASQIRVRVDSELNTRVAEHTKYTATGSATRGAQDVESLIRSRVDIELEGVEFAERHHDQNKKVYYTLAVLDRSLTAANLEKKIKKLRAKGKHYYEEGQALADKDELRDSLRSLNHSLDALAEAEAKETVLSVIEGRPVDSSLDELSPWQAGAKIDEVRRMLVYLIKIYEINPFSEKSDFVESALVIKLNELGLNAVHAGEAFIDLEYGEVLSTPDGFYKEEIGDRARYLILGEVEAKKSSRTRIGKKPFFFYKSRADVKMINVRTDRIIFTVAFDWEEATKAGRSSKEQAAALSLEKAGDIIADRLVAAIEKYLGAGAPGRMGSSN